MTWKYSEATCCSQAAPLRLSPFVPLVELDAVDPFLPNGKSRGMNVCLMDKFRTWSQDELRLVDYERGKLTQFDLVI